MATQTTTPKTAKVNSVTEPSHPVTDQLKKHFIRQLINWLIVRP